MKMTLHIFPTPRRKTMRSYRRRGSRSLQIVAITILLVASSIIQCSSAAEQENPSPQVLLEEAVQADDPVAIEKAIVELGAGINVQGMGAQTPLVSAVLRGKLQAVNKLLTLGADVSIPEKDGYTVMHAAGFQGRSAILKVLAAHNNHGATIDVMEQHADGYFPLHRACWGREQRHTETVQAFLELGVSPDLEAANGKTCLGMTKNPETRSLIEAASWEL
jgi:ankyrin repeat protein